MSASRHTLLVGAGFALAALFEPSSASATAFCNLKKTSDGFVALRNAPNAQAKLIGRMSMTDEVMIGAGRKGDWIEVTWWRGEERHTRGFGAHAGRGWANRKLIEEECG